MTSSINKKKNNISFSSLITSINEFRSKISHDVLLVEFADKYYPVFENTINAMFKYNPVIANSATDFMPHREAYLDSIKFVLRELFAELNFEFLYWGRGHNITSTNPEDLLIFIPDDSAILSKSVKAAHKLAAADSYWDFKTYLSDMFRESSDWKHTPELRSIPRYYDIKFSFNPNFKAVAKREIKGTFNRRIHDNLYFEVGFSKAGIEIPDELAWGGVSELWEKS